MMGKVSGRMKENLRLWLRHYPTRVFFFTCQKIYVIEQPLHSLLWGPGAGLAYFSHLVVWLEEGASVTYMHEAASPDEPAGHSLHGGIVEIYVGPRANLRFVELQSWGEPCVEFFP